MIAAPPNTSSDANDFFQSDLDLKAQLKRDVKKAKLGEAGAPIQLSSKVLAMLIPFGFSQNEENADEGDASQSLIAFVGESGHVARRLDLLSGKTKSLYRGHTGPVTCLAYSASADGREFLFTGSWDKSIRQWDVKTKESLLVFNGHSDFIKSVAIHNNVLLSGSSDSTLKAWEIASGKPLTTCKGIHKRAIEALAVDLDGQCLYTGSSDTTIRKWAVADLAQGKLIPTSNEAFATHLTSVYSLRIIDEDMWSVSADKTAKRWNLVTGKCDMNLEHPDFVKCVCVVGPYIFTGGRDENIRVWDAASGDLLNVIEGHFGEISCMEAVGSKLWTGSLDGTIRQWDLKDIAQYKFIPPTVEEIEEQETLANATGSKMMTEDEERELAELMDD
ncbi:hypothetical protein HDU97_003302 [Phlyctochytrium planicorne]|nr:hypothetical protein HDU97_003302 [Phlyctochytrium planicorne]